MTQHKRNWRKNQVCEWCTIGRDGKWVDATHVVLEGCIHCDSVSEYAACEMHSRMPNEDIHCPRCGEESEILVGKLP